jgi:hypothetical protein
MPTPPSRSEGSTFIKAAYIDALGSVFVFDVGVFDDLSIKLFVARHTSQHLHDRASIPKSRTCTPPSFIHQIFIASCGLHDRASVAESRRSSIPSLSGGVVSRLDDLAVFHDCAAVEATTDARAIHVDCSCVSLA